MILTESRAPLPPLAWCEDCPWRDSTGWYAAQAARDHASGEGHTVSVVESAHRTLTPARLQAVTT